MANPIVTTPVSGSENAKSESPTINQELSMPYTYKRSVTVRALTNYSAYRQANIAVLGRRRSNIGSSISATNILSTNRGELEAYFPNIVGIDANNPNFISRVKDYLSNIQVPVDDSVTFDCSFYFNHKEDYLKFKAAEDKINDAFEAADKRDLKSLKDAITKKISAINALESNLYLVGNPVNVTQYIMYRHVLLYKEVAKDMSIANSDRSVRFYLVDEAREKNKQEKKMLATKKAMQSYIALGSNDEKFNAVFIRYCVLNHLPLSEYMSKDMVEKNVLLSSFLNEEPIRFNEICNDANLILVAMIERLIARGELVRSEFNQQINTADGVFIGKNMNDAIAYFNNPENANIRAGYEAKLKLVDF